MQTVTSRDGTAIAYEVAGTGPVVVLVGTTAGDRHDLDGLARLLADGFHDGARALLPRASYRVLPGQDHIAFWMAPDTVAASVADLLSATAR